MARVLGPRHRSDAAAFTGAAIGCRTGSCSYFPDRFEWQHKKPDDVGMDPLRLDEAVKFAIANENPANRDLNLTLATTFRTLRAVRHADRPGESYGLRERPHHPTWLHRRRMG